MRELFYYHELEDMYEELLNDCYDAVSVCGLTYEQGTLLRGADPIAFRCGVLEWEGEEFEEVVYGEMSEEERGKYGVVESVLMYVREGEE